jgi:hypothetical protein
MLRLEAAMSLVARADAIIPLEDSWLVLQHSVRNFVVFAIPRVESELKELCRQGLADGLLAIAQKDKRKRHAELQDKARESKLPFIDGTSACLKYERSRLGNHRCVLLLSS